jgi:hypothetical protein
MKPYHIAGKTVRHANFGRAPHFLLHGLSYMRELFPGRAVSPPGADWRR